MKNINKKGNKMSKIQLLKRSKKMFFCFPAICLLLSGCGLFNNSVQPINIVTEESTVSNNNQTYIDNKEYDKIVINSEEEAEALLNANTLPVTINTESISYDGPTDPETINQEVKEKYGENAEFDMWEYQNNYIYITGWNKTSSK